MFPVIEVDENAAESTEQLGTKEKFWFRHPELGRCLFKVSRQNTGEDWSEKIAAELCNLLGLPHARYELAISGDMYGTISPSFMPEGGALIHGNELLLQLVPGYGDAASGYRVPQHTIDLVLNTIGNEDVNLPLDWTPLDGIHLGVEVFVGYLLLDAWIGNTDRHHENWALIERFAATSGGAPDLHLAPTYDHASSLGRNELDENRQRRMVSRDKNFTVEAYVQKARSALYLNADDRRPVTQLEAFRHAAQRYPAGASVWLDRLASIPMAEVDILFERIPVDRLSPIASEFARRILLINRDKLLA